MLLSHQSLSQSRTLSYSLINYHVLISLFISSQEEGILATSLFVLLSHPFQLGAK
jgi:hypothetical protein